MATDDRARILCVDDETTGLTVRKMLLEMAGYSVLTAADGSEGIRLFSQSPVDAVVLDYAMPGLNGAEVALHMRQVKPTVPILMLSAYMDLPQEALQRVDRFLTKGQPPTVLLHELERLLNRGRHSHPELEGDCLAWANAERRYIEVSDGYCRLLGYSREELLSKSIDDVSAEPISVPDIFQNYVQKGRLEGTHVLQHRDGRRVPIRFRAFVFPDGCMASRMEPLAEEEKKSA